MISIVELNERVVRSFDKLRYKLFIKFPINELNWTENELATYTSPLRLGSQRPWGHQHWVYTSLGTV